MSKSSKNYTNLTLHDQTNKITNRHNQSMKRMRLKTYSNSQRAQGGKGLLSPANSVHESHKSILLILEKKKEEEQENSERDRKERREGAWLSLLSCPARANQERRAPLLPVARRTHSLSPFASPPSLSLKTKLPLSARIKLEGP